MRLVPSDSVQFSPPFLCNFKPPLTLRFAKLLRQDLAVRILGGHSLLVLARLFAGGQSGTKA